MTLRHNQNVIFMLCCCYSSHGEMTYTDAFAQKQHELVKAMKYHDKLDAMRVGMLRMEELQIVMMAGLERNILSFLVTHFNFQQSMKDLHLRK